MGFDVVFFRVGVSSVKIPRADENARYDSTQSYAAELS